MSCPVLYTVATGDAALTYIVPRDGKIVGVRWVGDWTALTDGSVARGELSFAATNFLTTNEANNIISMYAKQWDLTTSGMANGDMNEMVNLPIPIPVEAGEKLYFHNLLTGPSSQRIRIQIFINDGTDTKTAMRRR